MTCRRLDVQNAVITSNDKMKYNYNERVRYTCSEGYTGHFTLTCQDNVWSGNPQCRGKEIQNNKFSVDVFVGCFVCMCFLYLCI